MRACAPRGSHAHVARRRRAPALPRPPAYQSTAFPALSGLGASDPRHVYTPATMRGIVSYARDRGVRVVVELDTPGHCFPSWGKGGPPDLLTTCGAGGGGGPLRADRDETYVAQ